MSLTLYKKKRRFRETPEPEGKIAQKMPQLRFVIQKHDATRLHYDFRLEMEGVMKSWAVPKGPSMNPGDRRLAMMVEDHPIDYNAFEGNIPEGNYGAGSVMIWDEGFYAPLDRMESMSDEDVLLKELKKGHLSFAIKGQKIEGAFSLLKMHGAKEKNAWLLIKKEDQYASTEDITKQDRSVKTGRNQVEIAGETPVRKPLKASPKKSAVKTTRRNNDPMPETISPMLATLVNEPFDRKGWIFETKWDGYRAIATLKNGKVELVSRNNLSFDKFPAVAQAVGTLPKNLMLDGEIIVLGRDGRSDFQLIQNYSREKKGALRYAVFDLLYLDGYDLRAFPLLRRKELLRSLIPESDDVLLFSDHIEDKGIDFFALMKEKGEEGIMAKNGDSAYLSGKRTSDWLKIKTHRRQEVVIGGFTAPRKSRKKFGALVVGVYDGKDLLYAGHCGGGFNEKSLADIEKKLKPLVQKKCPFVKAPKTNEAVQWVKPILVCEVQFQEWTADGSMRQPIFAGLRPDKAPKDVHREKAMSAKSEIKDSEVKTKIPPSDRLKLTHLDKVYWPAEGITKRELIEYYDAVADVMLPYLKDRPETLLRHPNGIHGSKFYQKNVDHSIPDWVNTAEIFSESNEKMIRYLVCQDRDTLLYMANLGCIEINPWNSHLPTLDQPDYLILDLDPEDIGFDAVIETALAVRDILKKAGIDGIPKTSGKTGMHIFVPLGAIYDYEQCRKFAELLANLAHQKLPKITSVERSPKKRQQKVYIDYLQNSRGQTLAAPYSVRPWPGATVSTPLQWNEVKRGLDPADYTIRNALARIKKEGDLWKPVRGKSVDLGLALRKLSK